MKQLIFIHGGEAYSNEADFKLYLEQQEVDVAYKEKQRWHYVPALQAALGDDWQIIRPQMPCEDNAKYEYWKIWFEKYIPHLQDGVVLVGHSLGAMFLARYLSEHEMPVRVSKLVLVAAEFTRRSGIGPGEEDGEYFYTHLDNFSQLEQSADEIVLVYSRDDFVVPFDNLAMWAERLPSAHIVEFADKGHFLQERFLELVELIKK
jgi:predicted alpha/beta hydrolase family esterase